MNLLFNNEILKQLSDTFNHELYYTIIDSQINPNGICNLIDDIKCKRFANIFDALIVEVEKQVLFFDIDKEYGILAYINFKDDCIRELYRQKNRFVFKGMKLTNLFEERIEAENYLKNILLYKILEIEKDLNNIKVDLNI